jgi:hypothetical protein
MKAIEVLQQYAQGRQDFQGVNLRGLSFKNQDLSGADFSGADIRSTNFRGAKLQGNQFIGAKTGLQKRWIILLLIVTFILAALSGYFSGFSSTLANRIFDNSDIENIVKGWTGLATWIIFLIVLLRQGFSRSLVFIGITIAIGIPISYTLFVVKAFARVGALALVILIVVTTFAFESSTGTSSQ